MNIQRRFATLALTILLATGALTACTPTTPSPEPQNPPSTAPSTPDGTQTPNPTQNPATGEHPPATDNFTTLDNLLTPDGVTPEQFTQARTNVKTYLVAQTSNPIILSGEWQNATPQEILKELGGNFSPELNEYFTQGNWKNRSNTVTTTSIAPFFSPTKTLQPTPQCAAGEPTGCITGEYGVKKASTQTTGDTIVFNVDTYLTHALIQNGEPVTQNINYTNIIAVHAETGTITTLRNTYRIQPLNPRG